MNKVKKSQVTKIDKYLKEDPNNETFIVEKILVDEICLSRFDEHHGESLENDDQKDIVIEDEKFNLYIEELSPSCNQMLLRCHFSGRRRDCMDLFENVITDEGKCCTFNLMPMNVMMNHMYETPFEEYYWGKWTSQFGYPELPELDGTDSERPRRVVAPGLSMGLSLVLNVQQNEYYCSGTESVGFKTLLHSPLDFPEVLEYGFGINAGSETFLSLLPHYIHSKDEIHSLDYKTRQCYFEDEKSLKFFKHFTFINCIVECIANSTLHHCGCAAYYMPREEGIPLCSPEKILCIEKAKIHAEESNAQEEAEDSCKCLPSCTEISYGHETSLSSLRMSDMLHLKPNKDTHKEIYDNIRNNTFVNRNLAVVHVFFKSLHFIRHERGQIFGPIDFLANVGGILGLCAGSSLLSVFEIAYFFIQFFNSFYESLVA